MLLVFFSFYGVGEKKARVNRRYFSFLLIKTSFYADFEI